MPNISKEKKDKISEQILHYLFELSPDSAYTSRVAASIARDEEFVKSLLAELEKNKLVIQISKSKTGKEYLRRQRWSLALQVYEVYKNQQSTQAKGVTPQNSENFNENE